MKTLHEKGHGAVTAGICLLVTLGFPGIGHSADESLSEQKFELIILEDTIGESEIIAGNVGAAIEKLQDSDSLSSSYAKNTSLCAAHTAAGEFSRAEKHCKIAIRNSSAQTLRLNGYQLSHARAKELKALALNNLGVMLALRGDTAQARDYFESAGKKSKRMADTSARNIAAMEQRARANAVAAS